MSIKGTGMTLNFGDLSLDLNKDISLIDNPAPYDEGVTLTATIKFEPEFMPPIPDHSEFSFSYITPRQLKRLKRRLRRNKARSDGSRIKQSKRGILKKITVMAFNGVVESGDGENITIRKV